MSRPALPPKPKININDYLDTNGSLCSPNSARSVAPPLPARPRSRINGESPNRTRSAQEYPSNIFLSSDSKAEKAATRFGNYPPSPNNGSPPRNLKSRSETSLPSPKTPRRHYLDDETYQRSAAITSPNSVPASRRGSESSLMPYPMYGYPSSRDIFSAQPARTFGESPSSSRHSTLASQSSHESLLSQTRHAQQEITLKVHDANHHPPASVPTAFLSSKARKLLCCNDRYVCVSTGYKVLLYSWRSGSLIWERKLSVNAAVIVPSSNAVWVGTSAGSLIAVGINSGIDEHILEKGHVKPVTFLSMTSQGDVVSLSAEDGKVNLWSRILRNDGRDKDIYPYQTYRIMGKCLTVDCSDDYLWTARDVKVDAYNLRASNIHQLSSTLTKRGASLGTVASLATRGGFAFFGQNDGFITVFDGPNFLGSINGGIHTITALAAPTGTELWAGTRSGEILVFSLRINHDAVEQMQLSASLARQWKAHKTAVMQLQNAEPKAAVLSMDRGGEIKGWNSTPSSVLSPSPSPSESLNVQVLTWNVDACAPDSVNPEWLIEPVRDAQTPPDIVAIGFQEVIELESKSQAARKMIRTGDAELSGEYEKWSSYLENLLVPLGLSLIATKPLVGIITCVFVKRSLVKYVSELETNVVKTGMGGRYGNKGSVITKFRLRSMSFCFINCHLAAGHTAILQRNRDANEIVLSSSHLDYDACFFFGDTNYRINAVREQADGLIKNKNWERLRQQDQLTSQITKNPSFSLGKFQEGSIDFAPTYKFDRGTNRYDTSDKKRIPSWCDRILFRGKSIHVDQYRSLDTRTSDHKAVFGAFLVPILK